MARKAFHIAAICGAAICAVFFIAAMASSSWMIGCMQISNVIEALKGIQGADSENTAAEMEQLKNVQGMSFCIHQGLYKLSIDFASLVHISVGIDFAALPRAVIFGGVAMAGAIICAVAAAIALLMATAGNLDSYEHKSKVASRTRVGMILLVAAGSAGIAGMACYTAGTAQMVHNPLLFFAHMGQSAASSFQNIMTDPGMGRYKRDVSESDVMAAATKMIEGMDPVYGYAFALGWIAAVVLIVAAAFSALAKQRVISQSYNGPDSSMKL